MYLVFKILRIKAMNKNQFMSISTYGFKIYNKDEKKIIYVYLNIYVMK